MQINKAKRGTALNGKGRHKEGWLARRDASQREIRQQAIASECVRDERGVLICPPKFAVGYGINRLKTGL